MGDLGRYRKTYTRIWRQPAFRRLRTSARLLALYMLTGPQTNRIGLCHFSVATAAEDLNVTTDAVKSDLDDVCAAFGWMFDADARVLYVPSWWRWNPPENPNVLKGCLADLGEVPPTPLIERFANRLETLPATLHETFRERLTQPYPERSRTQEQDQELKRDQQQEQDKEGSNHLVRPQLDDAFDRFWTAYPKKVGKDAAYVAWHKHRPDAALCAEILNALERHRAFLMREDGRFVPNPATWLNEGRWKDDPPAPPESAFTTDELRDAKRQRDSLGQCPHDPRCNTYNGCLKELIRQCRRDRGEAA